MTLYQLAPWKRGTGNLHREFDDIFENFFRGFSPAIRESNDDSLLAPRIDVTETDKAFNLTAELPGVEEKDVDVSLSGNVLTIKGEKKSEYEEKDEKKNYHRVERSYGSFQRSLTLPEEVDQAKIDASFKNGVLTIEIPKTAEKTPEIQKIKVKSS